MPFQLLIRLTTCHQILLGPHTQGKLQHLRMFLQVLRPDNICLSSWANQICADDYQERGIVLASMKCASCFQVDVHLLLVQHVEQRDQCLVALAILPRY